MNLSGDPYQPGYEYSAIYETDSRILGHCGFSRRDPHRHVVQRIPVNLVSQSWFAWGVDISVLRNADAIFHIGRFKPALRIRHLEHEAIRHREFAVKVRGLFQSVSPIVRRALHIEALCEARNLHPLGDPTDVGEVKPQYSNRPLANVFTEIV